MSIKSFIRTTSIAISLVTSFLLPSEIVHAGVITFFDSTDNISFSDTTGRVTSSSCIGEVCSVTFTPPTPNPSGSSATQSRINIFEANSPTVVSDTLEITSFQGLFTATFISDSTPLGLLPLASPAHNLVETGAVQNAFTITWFGPNFSIIDVDTVAFVSEIDTVPEPANLVLVGLGLAGMAVSRFRKQRANAVTRVRRSQYPCTPA